MDEQTPKTGEVVNENKPKTAPNPNRTLMACLAYVLFFIPMITGDSKRDEFVKYHTKQGFALFILWFTLGVLGWVIPFFKWMPIMSLLNLATLILFIIGIVNAAGDKKQPLPVIGFMADWLKI